MIWLFKENGRSVPRGKKVVKMDVAKEGGKFQRHEMGWQGLGKWEERKI